MYDLALVWDMRHFGVDETYLTKTFAAYGCNPLLDPVWSTVTEIRTIRGALSNYLTATTLTTENISANQRRQAALRLKQASLHPLKRDRNFRFTDINKAISLSRKK